MHLDRRFARSRRGSALAVLGVVLAAAAMLSLSQCRSVDERLTGVAMDKGHPDKCFQECNKDFDKGMKEEDKLHDKNVKACRRDPVCLALEQARHDAAVDQLKVGLRQCEQGCHHQGRGGGGR